MTVRRFTNTSTIIFSIVAVLFFAMAAHAEQVSVDRDLMIDLVKQVEELQKQVEYLTKTVQVLNDFLDEITTASKTHKVAPQVEQPPLRSPRQIDRDPIGDEKTATLITQMQVLVEEDEAQKVLAKLIQTNKGGDFPLSLRAQVINWIQTPAADRSFDFPLSPKQYAWARFLMFPTEYANPKTDKDLYPEG